jgi:hypothetical protein
MMPFPSCHFGAIYIYAQIPLHLSHLRQRKGGKGRAGRLSPLYLFSQNFQVNSDHRYHGSNIMRSLCPVSSVDIGLRCALAGTEGFGQRFGRIFGFRKCKSTFFSQSLSILRRSLVYLMVVNNRPSSLRYRGSSSALTSTASEQFFGHCGRTIRLTGFSLFSSSPVMQIEFVILEILTQHPVIPTGRPACVWPGSMAPS